MRPIEQGGGSQPLPFPASLTIFLSHGELDHHFPFHARGAIQESKVEGFIMLREGNGTTMNRDDEEHIEEVGIREADMGTVKEQDFTDTSSQKSFGPQIDGHGPDPMTGTSSDS